MGLEQFHTMRRLVKIETKHFGNAVMAKFYLGHHDVQEVVTINLLNADVDTLVAAHPAPIGYPAPTVVPNGLTSKVTYHRETYTPHFGLIQLGHNLANTNTWQGKWYSAGAKALTAYDIIEFLVQGSRYLAAAHEGKNTTDIRPQHPFIPSQSYNRTDCHFDHKRYDWREATSRVYVTVTSVPAMFLHDLPTLAIHDPTLVFGFTAHFATAWGMMELASKIAGESGHVIVVTLHLVHAPWGQHAKKFFTTPGTLLKMYLTLFSFPMAASIRPVLSSALHEALDSIGWYNHNAEQAYESAYGAGDKLKWGWPGYGMLIAALATLPPISAITDQIIQHKKPAAILAFSVFLTYLYSLWHTEITETIGQICTNEKRAFPITALCFMLITKENPEQVK